MADFLINQYTIEHLLFGIGAGIFFLIISKLKFRVSLMSLSVIILWEIFEYRQSPRMWMLDYLDNLIDILVGFTGILIGTKIIEIYTYLEKRLNSKNRRE